MLERLSRAWIGAVATLLLVAAAFSWAPGGRALTDRFFREQDLPVLLAIAIAAAILRLAPRLADHMAAFGARLANSPTLKKLEVVARGPWAIAALAASVGVVAVAGGWLVCAGYPLSMDEFMVEFGSKIHSRGQLLAHVAEPWRAFVPALQPEFAFWTQGATAWTSSYLPINSAMRALAGLLGAQWLVSPILAAFSILAVYGIARRLWPARPGAAVVAAVLLGTSGQLLITAMTPYAMTAHLAFNLAWLWLFLRGDRLGHAGAIIVGFFACGLHQLVFHLLFVAPFILQALLERRWRVVALYSAAYGAIGLFWIEYWPIALSLSGPATLGALHHAAAPTGAAGGAVAVFCAKIIDLLSNFSFGGIGLMAKNLVRFAAWQNPLLVALVLTGAAAAFRAGGVLRALVLGLTLCPLAMLFLLPYQGHGWGYRYLHGFLGSAALVAAHQWFNLYDAVQAKGRSVARVGFVGAALISSLVLAPMRAWQAHAFIAPYARANSAIHQSKAEIVLVDDNDAWFTRDLVRNDPYLERRPLVMRLASLSDEQVRQLCAGHTLALFDAKVADRFGIETNDPLPDEAPTVARLRAVSRLSCGIQRLPLREIG